MFFRFLTYIMPYFTFRVFFRRVFYSGLKKVPLDKPLLFVGNHQNSFMDGMLVGSWLTQPIHFLMRADMFRKPLARFCLRELNVAPVYRIEEGLENVHRNLETFEEIYEILKKNGNFVVFSEGICVQEKRLQKLRKGTARMAFGAEEKHGLDVHIVPVGVNYTYPASFRKEVMINFHEAFSILDLKDLYKSQPARALLAFNEKCEQGLRKEVIIIEDPANDWLAEEILRMGRNDMVHPFFRWRFDTDDRRQMEKRLSDRINELAKSSPDVISLLNAKVSEYNELLSAHGLKDMNVARKPDMGFLRYFGLVAGLPLFLAGYISNLIPFVVPKTLCDRLIKDKRFYASVYVSSGTVLYLIYFPLVLILSAVFAGLTGFLLALTVPLLGYLVLFYREVFIERYHTLRFSLASVLKRPLVEELKKQRKEILSWFS